MQGGGVVLLLGAGLVTEGVAAQDDAMQELEDPILTGGMHALLGPPCSADTSIPSTVMDRSDTFVPSSGKDRSAECRLALLV